MREKIVPGSIGIVRYEYIGVFNSGNEGNRVKEKCFIEIRSLSRAQRGTEPGLDLPGLRLFCHDNDGT